MPPSESAFPASSRLGIVRGFAAFILNLIAALVGPPSLGGVPFHRLLRAYFPSMSAAERELLVGVVLVVLVALAVANFWSTTTAKWIWIVPVPLLFFRIVIFSSGHFDGVWRHFFNPDLFSGFTDTADFTFFTVPAVRTATYSFVVWASAKWTRSKLGDPVVAAASGRLEPISPVIWPGPKFRWFTATNVLIGINVALFAATVASGVPFLFPRPSQLVPWGANIGILTLNGQYWRLITYSFIHFGMFHLAVNMICLWWIGRLAEKIFGSIVLISIYFLAGIGAGLLSLAWAPLIVHEGSSGAILGIAGALIAVVFYGKLKLPQNHLFRRRIIVFVLWVLFVGLSPGVDAMAHLGGLVTGLLIGVYIVWALRKLPPCAAFSKVRLFQG